MYIYKYREFNINSLKALRENEIWFSRGVKFNDPFDCTLNVPLNLLSEQSVKDFIIQNPINSPLYEWSLKDPNFLNTVIKKQVMKAREAIQKDKLNEHALAPIVQYVWEGLHRSFVCCFSMESTNALLWSHYSNSHTGFCIRFKKEVLLKELEPYVHGNVSYINEPIDIMGNSMKTENLATKIILSKSDVWSYEKEYRFIHRDVAENESDDYRIGKYSNEAIDLIILGINSSESDLNLLKSVMSGTNVIYKRIKRNKLNYGLNVDTGQL